MKKIDIFNIIISSLIGFILTGFIIRGDLYSALLTTIIFILHFSILEIRIRNEK